MAKKLVLSSLTDLGAARVSMGLNPETAAPVVVACTDPVTTGDTNTAADPVAPALAEVVAEIKTATEDGLSIYLKGEVATLKAEAAALKTELAAFSLTNAQLQAANATIGHLRPVAEAAVQRLSIGLGHRASKLEHLPADLLASTFNELQAELMALPAGRQTAEPSVDTVDSTQPPETLAQHRLRLVPQAR